MKQNIFKNKYSGLTLELDHGRHQEEDAGDEGGEGQCHGQGRCLRASC